MELQTFWASFFVVLVCWSPALAVREGRSSSQHEENSRLDSLGEVKHSRQERAVGAALKATVQIVEGATKLFNVYKQVKELFGYNTETPEHALLADIKDHLRDISRTLDVNFEHVRQELHSQHQTTRVAAVFADDMLRLKYFRQFINNDANFNATTNQIIVNEASQAWVEAILSESSDGMGPVLFNIHNMVTGFLLSGTEPITDIYMKGLLLSGNTNIVEETNRLVETLVNMQVYGYVLWALALDLSNRNGEINSTLLPLLEQRATEQQEYLFVDEGFRSWPQGSYGLVQAAQGCPEGNWSSGWQIHDLKKSSRELSFSYAIEDYVKISKWQSHVNSGFFRKYYWLVLKWESCVHDGEVNSSIVEWPGGKYCIFAGSESCPTAFNRYWIFINEVEFARREFWTRTCLSGRFKTGGSVPYGDFGYASSNSRYYFCCRQDGSETDEIHLPVTKPFVLFPLANSPCQRVRYMNSKELSFYFEVEDYYHDEDELPWSYASQQDIGRDIQVRMCYYSANIQDLD